MLYVGEDIQNRERVSRTSVEEAEILFSEGIQSLAKAANNPYKGNTNAPNSKFKKI